MQLPSRSFLPAGESGACQTASFYQAFPSLLKNYLQFTQMQPSVLKPFTIQVLTISRCDRWQVYQRLQELSIACRCTVTGQLEVEIHSPLTIVQLRSVIQQFTRSRGELVGWLERCWQADGKR